MALDPSVLIGLGEALSKGLPAFNNASAMQLERQQQAAKEAHDAQLLALAVSRGELDKRQADDARAHTAFEENYQTQNANRLNQQANLSMLSQFPGATLNAEQVKSLDLGPMQSLALSPVAPSEGVKIYTSPDATPGSLQTVGQVAAGTMRVSPTFNDQIKRGMADLKGEEQQLRYLAASAKTEAEAQHWKSMADVAAQRASAAEARAGSLNPYQTEQTISALNKQYQANTKDQRMVMENFKRMKVGLDSLTNEDLVNRNPAATNIIDSFQRILNPGSVVRQTAYANSVKGQALLDSINAKLEQWRQGGPALSTASLKEFYSQAAPIAQMAQRMIDAEHGRIKHRADRLGLDMADILPEEPAETPGGTPPPGTTPPPGNGKTWVVGPDGKVRLQ